jgi:allantoin racemase
MRILVLAPVTLDESALRNRASQSDHFAEVTGTEFVFRGVVVGPLTYDNYQDWLLAEFGILQAGCNAVAEGFDAVCIDTLSDAGVNALRSALDIPVVGAGQAAYLMALALGRRFSILTQWQPWFAIYEKGLHEAGIRDRCISMRSVDLRPDLENLLGGKEEQVLPILLAEAQNCVADGADVIVLGSTTMHQAHAYLSRSLPVPVVNPGPASYALAHSLHTLGERGHSRVAFQRADADADLLREMAGSGEACRAARKPSTEHDGTVDKERSS